ncbi:MAG TPA: UDP-N-acetylglucosamine 2-epimerase (non-hydrolyzing) [Tenuifilaceae bacterium]|nr:UDP-N-acetylglucosamine 2-epimerase (non-hydrolyzing) [Tenuifilaceae bacterium]
MKIISVVGARPNFMKVAPFIKAIGIHNKGINVEKVTHVLVHTGQHYDDRMSKKFFEDLGIPNADINLGIGSGSHAEQVGNSMIALEKVFENEKPDWVVIYGDVNATLAASVTAKKLHIKVCHVEAGLRSGDIRMPEEINRLVTDRLSDLLLTPDKISIENLKKEGVPDSAIRFVGNIMIDTLESNRDKANALDLDRIVLQNLIVPKNEVKIKENEYAVMTLHRPSNVDDKEILTKLVNFVINEVSSKLAIVWAIHPRTEKQLKQFSIWDRLILSPNIYMVNPLGYHEMLKLNMYAKIMLTDSGGLQEECTVLGTPCLTMRWNTERPITLREHGGVSILVGNNVERIKEEFFKALKEARNPERPELWDGNTAERCLSEILSYKE